MNCLRFSFCFTFISTTLQNINCLYVLILYVYKCFDRHIYVLYRGGLATEFTYLLFAFKLKNRGRHHTVLPRLREYTNIMQLYTGTAAARLYTFRSRDIKVHDSCDVYIRICSACRHIRVYNDEIKVLCPGSSALGLENFCFRVHFAETRSIYHMKSACTSTI